MIQSYQFGEMQISGKHYYKDLKIIGETVISPWWRNEGHYLCIADLEDILAAQPDTLIVGKGAYQAMQIAPDLLQKLNIQGIELLAQATNQAVELFNEYHGRQRNVAGAFHLSC